MKTFPLVYVRGIWGKSPQHMRDRVGVELDEFGLQKGVRFSHEQYIFPKTTALQASSRKRIIAQSKGLAEFVAGVFLDTGVAPTLLCHSYGNVLGHRLAWHKDILMEAGLDSHDLTLCCFHAALESDYLWGDIYGDILNFHEPQDKALKWGKRIPFHNFGPLGAKGYTGPQQDDINVVNHQAPTIQTKAWNKHDNWFEGTNKTIAAKEIINVLTA